MSHFLTIRAICRSIICICAIHSIARHSLILLISGCLCGDWAKGDAQPHLAARAWLFLIEQRQIVYRNLPFQRALTQIADDLAQVAGGDVPLRQCNVCQQPLW